MFITPKEKIREFANSLSRNKIIIHKNQLTGIDFTDIGLFVSEFLFGLKNDDNISMKVFSELDKHLNNSIKRHEFMGSYLAIKNLGILFERELKTDFLRLIDTFSQNGILFVHWEGEIGTNTLYFQSKENGIKIDIKNLSHIIL